MPQDNSISRIPYFDLITVEDRFPRCVRVSKHEAIGMLCQAKHTAETGRKQIQTRVQVADIKYTQHMLDTLQATDAQLVRPVAPSKALICRNEFARRQEF